MYVLGLVGAQGAVGAQGLQGAQGAQGSQGMQGQQGFSILPPLKTGTPINIIMDTDFQSGDVDDAIALRYLLTHDYLGVINLLAIVISASNPLTAAAIDNICENDGRQGDMPIGQWQGAAFDNAGASYLTDLSGRALREFPTSAVSLIADAIRVYRRTLVSVIAGGNKTHIVMTGQQNNLQALLQSPADDISSSTGMALVTAGVDKIIVMGGQYPTGTESNFDTQPAAAAYTTANCPVPMTFVGYEVGQSVISGGDSLLVATNDPIANTLADFGYPYGRNSWDPMAAVVAVLGETGAGCTTVAGTNSVNAGSGTNTFTPGAGTHMYVVKAQSDDLYSDEINNNMYPPRRLYGKRATTYAPDANVNFTPDQARVPPMAWWMASDLNVTSALATWPGHGPTNQQWSTHSLAQLTSANRPAAVNTSSGMRVRFNGTNWMDCLDTILQTQDVTIFVVVQSNTSATAAYTEWIVYPVSLTAHTAPYFYIGMGRVNNNYWSRFSGNNQMSTGTVDWTKLHIAEISSGDGGMNIDGTSSILAQQRQTLAYGTTTGVRVGANGAGLEGHIGDILEIILFPSAMKNQDRRGVRAYLKRKYVLSVFT